MNRLFVLYDDECGLCRRLRGWLAHKPVYVPFTFIPFQSPDLPRRFPGIEAFHPEERLVVISDEGDLSGDNVLLAARHVTEHAPGINLAIVGISNVVMLAILAVILLGHGIPIRRTASWWMVVLNGSGAVLFAVFFCLLHTP